MGGARMPQFIERWPTEPDGPPLLRPESEDVVIEILDTVHDSGEAQLKLYLAVKNRVPIDALAVVLTAEDLDLRPPVFDRTAPLIAPPIEYLVSGGRLIYRSRIEQALRLAPGEVVYALEMELPRGTVAGTYEIAVDPGTEAVLETGEVLRPTSLAGALAIIADIETGSDLGFPPIDFVNLEERRIGGAAELRLVNHQTQVVPGEFLSMTFQARLDRPANHVPFSVGFDGRQLEITNTEILFTDPRFQVDYWGVAFNASWWRPVIAGFSGRFEIGDALEAERLYELNRSLSSLGYFSPLGEWVDLIRITLRVRDEAQNGDVVFKFDWNYVNLDWQESVLVPYAPRQGVLSMNAFANCRMNGAFWSYEPTDHHPAAVTVVGGRPPGELPPPMSPEQAGIFFQVGSADAQPGDLVVLPVRMRSLVELYILRMTLRFDEQRLEFLGAEVEVVEEVPVVSVRSEFLSPERFRLDTLACSGDFPNRTCAAAFPVLGYLYGPPRDEVPADVVAIELMTGYFYGGGRVYGGRLSWDVGVEQEVLKLHFRVRHDAPQGEALVEGVEVEWRLDSDPAHTVAVSGGFPILDPKPKLRADVPALAVNTGVVRVGAAGFTRGDANRDDRVDISDAVSILNALFLGSGPIRCPDAADTNDDGRNDLSDAVYILNYSFLGGPQPPPPYPEAGPDPTEDGLECSSGG
jgi:hypothetical protein